MKKLKKHYLMSNYIFLSLALCLSSFGYAAEQEKEAKETPPTFEQFDKLPNELQFQILLTRAIDDINEAQTLDQAIKQVSTLGVNQNTRAIVESTRFVSHIMPALLNFINRTPKLGINAFDRIVKVPFIQKALAQLQKETNTHNFLAALLTIESLEEPLKDVFIKFSKETIAKQYPGIQFATGLNLYTQSINLGEMLNNKLYQQALLNDDFISSINADKKTMIQQLLLQASAQKNLLDWAHVLINHGADVNLADRSTRFSPMSYALFHQNIPLLKLFFENGGKITSDTFVPMINPSLTPTPTIEQLKATFIMKKPKIKEVIDKYGDQETKDFFYGKED